jgi:predicted ABC-type transport system involved in lysophospholipase L1 biosynthesis ATPase subunit
METGSPDTREIAVQLVDVVKSYPCATAPVFALRNVFTEIRKGERIALLGKSGSGKSTLLNLLAGLDRPTSGNIRVNGRDMAEMTAQELAQYRLTSVGMVFQAYNLIPSRTALENVELPMIFGGTPPRIRRPAARNALEAVGLVHRLHHHPNELSGGECQRVAFARALVNRPDLLLADEPTGNLDTATSNGIIAFLTSYLRDHGTTLVLVTHDEDLARRCADRILRMQDGCLIS